MKAQAAPHSSLIIPHSSLPEEDLGDAVDLLVEALDLAHGGVEGDADDLVAAQRDHLPPPRREHQLEGAHPEARGEHAVEGRGGAAALRVAEVGVARLDPRPALDLAREVEADAAEPPAPVDLLLRRLVEEVLFGVRVRVLGDDDDGEGAALALALAQKLADAREAEGVLGDE